MHPQFSDLDPTRLPSWRYDRVQRLWRNGQHPLRATRYDDQYVRGCLQFMREYQAAVAAGEVELAETGHSLDDAPAMMDLFGRRPEHWYAWRMYSDADHERRAIVEAAILARENDRQVAARLGTLPAAIAVYEKVFFNVRDRIDASTWIATAALGPWEIRMGLVDGVPPRVLREVHLKTFAYYGGSNALDAVLSGFQPGDYPLPEDVEAWFAAKMRGGLKVKAATTLQTLQPDKFTSLPLVDAAVRAISQESRGNERDDDRQQTSIESAVQSLVDDIPWELAVTKKLTPLEQKYSGAVEPRADQQLMIAAGIEPPGLAEYCQAAEANLAERRR